MNSTDNKMRAVFILEVLGRPPEHLVETLEGLVEKIKEEKGVTLINKIINSPVLMKDQKDFYTSFAEIEIEVESLIYLAVLMFKYMPAHIDILSPQNITLANSGWNDILNELIRRLHGYEEIARILQTEKIILENKLREAMNPRVQTKENPKEEKENKTKKSKKKK